jgi:transposase InsO family protein
MGLERDRVRGGGFEYVHVAIDDHSRIATVTVEPNEQAGSAVRALQTTLAWYGRLGIRFKTVLTENGPYYRSRKFTQPCRKAGLKHRHTRPYTPRTNGKAERFIQIALREWAYACAYDSSEHRNSIQKARWPHPAKNAVAAYAGSDVVCSNVSAARTCSFVACRKRRLWAVSTAHFSFGMLFVGMA